MDVLWWAVIVCLGILLACSTWPDPPPTWRDDEWF